MNINKKLSLFCLFLLLICMAAGCKPAEHEIEEGKFYIYYLEQSENKLYPVEGILSDNSSIEEQTESVWSSFVKSPEDAVYVSAVPKYVELISMTISNDTLVLDLSQSYYDMNTVSEVLFRAACVQTFTQIEGISFVQILVNGQTLTKSDGTVIGAQNSSRFVDLVGKGINSVTKTTLVLYFSNQAGTHLITQSIDVGYDNEYPIEQYVVSRLIQGPAENDGTVVASLPQSVQVIQVSTADGVCHVNLSDAFIKDALDIEAYIPVYSIVNSLTELPGINSVMISINGSSNITFKDQISLLQPLSRNLDYVWSE